MVTKGALTDITYICSQGQSENGSVIIYWSIVSSGPNFKCACLYLWTFLWHLYLIQWHYFVEAFDANYSAVLLHNCFTGMYV